MSPRLGSQQSSGSVVDGQKDDFGSARNLQDFAGGPDAIHSRHIDIEKNDVGSKLSYFVDGLVTIRSLAAHAKRVPMEK